MPHIVKITRDDNGEKIKHAKWCLVFNDGQGNHNFCEKQFFGPGESKAEYQTKEGKITCPRCVALIKRIKAVKL